MQETHELVLVGEHVAQGYLHIIQALPTKDAGDAQEVQLLPAVEQVKQELAHGTHVPLLKKVPFLQTVHDPLAHYSQPTGQRVQLLPTKTNPVPQVAHIVSSLAAKPNLLLNSSNVHVLFVILLNL